MFCLIASSKFDFLLNRIQVIFLNLFYFISTTFRYSISQLMIHMWLHRNHQKFVVLRIFFYEIFVFIFFNESLKYILRCLRFGKCIIMCHWETKFDVIESFPKYRNTNVIYTYFLLKYDDLHELHPDLVICNYVLLSCFINTQLGIPRVSE